ncbi:unnamed protein product, partial [Prunus brigantina]
RKEEWTNGFNESNLLGRAFKSFHRECMFSVLNPLVHSLHRLRLVVL